MRLYQLTASYQCSLWSLDGVRKRDVVHPGDIILIISRRSARNKENTIFDKILILNKGIVGYWNTKIWSSDPNLEKV